jgi:integrase
MPLLGARRVASITAHDVEQFMHDVIVGKLAGKKVLGHRAVSNVRGGRGAASRTVGLLGAIFAYAVRKGIRPDNPVRGVIRPADGRRDRRLTAEEYGQLSVGLSSAGTWPHGAAAARFLVLSGWRTGEVTGLRWREVDLVRRTARLERTKTGPSLRPLSRDLVGLLIAQREAAADIGANALVFPASRGSGPMSGFRRIFVAIRVAGRLPADITPHVLRHSYASEAADLGYSEPTIAALIGHRGGGVTRRYIHSADAVLLEAADGVATHIASMLAALKRVAAA